MERLSRVAAVAATVAAAAALGSAAPAGAIQAPAQGGRPDFDARAGKRTAVAPATTRARDALARRLGTEARVSGDPRSGGIRSVGRTDGFLTAPSDDGAATVALDYVRDHPAVFGLDGDDLGALRLVRRSTSGDGVTHLTWMQTSRGIASYDGVLNANVSADGQLLNIGGATSADLALPTATPALTASQALRIAQQDVGGDAGLPRADADAGAERPTTFANGDSARLVAFAAPAGDRLAWRLSVYGEDPYLYDVVIDATTGALLARTSLTDFASAQVYALDPSAGPANTVDLARWLGDTAGGTRLNGPNAHAYADVGAPNGFNAGEDVASSGGGDWSYPLTPVAPAGGASCSTVGAICTWDGVNRALTEPTNRAQTTTQLFFYVNTFHDWLAQQPIGFDAASGAFEVNDPLNAEADDYGGLNNANMSTPLDGSSPRMQMYLFNGGFPAVNSGDDASVVYHEYTHGLSNRLLGGGVGGMFAYQQAGAMGEGWSDWYAFDYLVEQGLVTDGAADGDVAVGRYVTGNTRTGIRREALDCPVGSLAPACAGTASSGSGGFTLGDMGRVNAYANGPRFEVHDDGEIWAQTLWDLRGAVGASTARGLITNAMRLTTSPPSFLDERDAILMADTAAGGRDHDRIWQVFAARGMGHGASTPGPNATNATASFALPALTSASRSALDDAAPLGDGDGVLEPGEATRLTVTLDNPAAIPLTNVRARLSGQAGVVVGQARAAWRTIAAGGRGASTMPFAVTLPAAQQCGAAVALTLDVSSDQGAISLPLTLPVGSAGGWRPFASSGALALAIPDNAPGSGAVSTITAAEAGTISTVRVMLSIAHTYGYDLRALLTSPSGTTVELLATPGFSNSGFDGFSGLVLDDGAATAIQEAPAGGDGPAIGGRYRPDEALSKLAGEPRAGSWRLRVTDSFAGDTGTLTSWSLDDGTPTCATSAPALPSATTAAASAVTAAGATLAASVDAAGAETAYAFEYGATTDYGTVTPAASAGAGAGAQPRSAAIAGLAASTTYHYRVVALRGGTVVAVGADGSFTTSAPVVDPPAGGGGGGGGGGENPPGGGTPTTPTTPTIPPPAPRAAAPTLSVLPRTLTLTARNAFTLAFRATPAGARGTIRFTLPKQQRRAAVAFTVPFTVTARGTVRLTATVRGAALRRLRQLRSAKTAVTVTLGGRTFRRTLTLKLPRARRRR